MSDAAALTLATWNTGRGTPRDLAGLMEDADVIALQEASDRGDLKAYARRRDWAVVQGHAAGQPATPLLVSPEVRVGHPLFAPMLDGRPIGPGIGPRHNKPKSACGARLGLGHHVGAGVVSTHLVPTQGEPLRHHAAALHVEHLVAEFGPRTAVPWFIAGDFNAVPTSSVLRPLYRAGWTNTHRARHPLPTHGNRPIDYLWWRRDAPVELLEVHTVPTRSDHDALVATFELTPRSPRSRP